MEETNAGDVNATQGGETEGGGNGELPTWMSSAPDEYKTNEVLAKYPEFGDALKDLVSLKSDGSIVRIPGENATDAERAEFHSKMGRPAKAEDYNLAKPQLPEGMPYDPEAEKIFKELGHGLGFNQKQLEALHSKFYEVEQQRWQMNQKAEEERTQTENKAVEAAINDLKNEWTGDDFVKNVNIAVKAYEALEGDPELLDIKLGNDRFGNHPKFLRMFHKIGKLVLDDNTEGLRGGGSGGEIDTKEGQARTMYPAMYKDK